MPVETLGWISWLLQQRKMKNSLSGELVDLLGLTDILGSLQANSVLQLQSFLDALVRVRRWVYLFGLVLFTTYISAGGPCLLVNTTTVFPPWTGIIIFHLRTVADVEFVKFLQDRDFRDKFHVWIVASWDMRYEKEELSASQHHGQLWKPYQR